MRRRRAAQTCAVLFALSVGGTAHAAASRFELAWTSASVERPCISEQELKDAVSARLGRDPFVPAGKGEIAVEGREVPAPAGQLRARIVQRDHEGRVLGTRDLEATTCDELRRSATFVVFLIVDPDAALGGPPAPSAPQKQVVEEPSTTTPARADERAPSATNEKPRAPDTAPGRRPRMGAGPAYLLAPPAPRVRLDLGLALVVSNGLLPRPDIGPALALGLAPASLPIRFEWRATYRIAVEPVQGFGFRALEQEWRACYFRPLFGGMSANACAGATWMAILPEVRGLARGDQAPKTVFSPTFAVGPSFEVGETRMFLDLGLALPWPRYAFTYRDEGRAMPLHEVSRVVWSVGIGAARSFR